MELKLQQATILRNAIELGFDQELCLARNMHVDILDFANKHITDIRESYIYLFEKMVDYAENWICKHQVAPFVKEVFVDLHYKRAFGYWAGKDHWVDVDDFGKDLIDWEQYKDCQDTDKIFFHSALADDFKTVLKFFDWGSKRHQN